MVTVTYIQPDGAEKTVDVTAGHSVMEGAMKNGVQGFIAECGGACSCATCHGYIDDKWLAIVGKAEDDEADMLEFAEDAKPNSRLACQVEVHEGLEGMIVRIAKEQA